MKRALLVLAALLVAGAAGAQNNSYVRGYHDYGDELKVKSWNTLADTWTCASGAKLCTADATSGNATTYLVTGDVVIMQVASGRWYSWTVESVTDDDTFYREDQLPDGTTDDLDAVTASACYEINLGLEATAAPIIDGDGTASDLWLGTDYTYVPTKLHLGGTGTFANSGCLQYSSGSGYLLRQDNCTTYDQIWTSAIIQGSTQWNLGTTAWALADTYIQFCDSGIYTCTPGSSLFEYNDGSVDWLAVGDGDNSGVDGNLQATNLKVPDAGSLYLGAAQDIQLRYYSSGYACLDDGDSSGCHAHLRASSFVAPTIRPDTSANSQLLINDRGQTVTNLVAVTMATGTYTITDADDPGPATGVLISPTINIEDDATGDHYYEALRISATETSTDPDTDNSLLVGDVGGTNRFRFANTGEFYVDDATTYLEGGTANRLRVTGTIEFSSSLLDSANTAFYLGAAYADSFGDYDTRAMKFSEGNANGGTSRAGIQVYNDGTEWWMLLTDGGHDQVADGNLVLNKIMLNGTSGGYIEYNGTSFYFKTAAGAHENIYFDNATANSTIAGIHVKGTYTIRAGETQQTVTIADSGDGSPATDSTTALARSAVEVTCNDSDGCIWAPPETSISEAVITTITNVSANPLKIASSSGVMELNGDWVGDQYDALSVKYLEDRWVETGRTDPAMGTPTSLGTASVDLKTATTKTSIYTCPVLRTCVITAVVIRGPNASMDQTTDPSISFGWDASGSDVVADSTYISITATTDYAQVFPFEGADLGAASEAFGCYVNTASDYATAHTVTVEAIGYVY